MLIELQGVKDNLTGSIQKEVAKEFEKLDHAYHKTKKGGFSNEDANIYKKFKNKFSNNKRQKD